MKKEEYLMLTNIFTLTETLGNLKKLSFLLVDFHKVVYDNFLSNKNFPKMPKSTLLMPGSIRMMTETRVSLE